MSSVSISDLGKRYGAMSVIEGLSLEIEDGEFIILVGPSGCGKSTLLRMIAGLEEISEGHLYIGDRLVNEVRPRDRNIAMVFQNYALYPHKTVAQNLGFSLMLRGSSRTETDRKVRQTAEILGLGPLLDRYPKQLSGGQRQRVAMGRAIVRDPEVFLFDEPLSNLDAKLRVQMRTEIKALHERLKSTIVYVTHDQIEALTMADRIVVMNGGRIEQVGRPLEIYDHPENIFVAGFIGSPAMNMFDGEAIETTAGPRFRITDRLAIPLADRPPAKGSYTLGIRPEHLEIVHDVAMGVPATVLVHEPSGAETQMLFDLAGHRCLGTFKDRIEARPGDVLYLSFPPVRMHFFDRETGQRLNTGARPTAGYAAG